MSETAIDLRYAIVIETVGSNYSAYVPNLPGCVATGKTIAEVKSEIREAISFHVEGLLDDGLPIPELRCEAGARWESHRHSDDGIVIK